MNASQPTNPRRSTWVQGKTTPTTAKLPPALPSDEINALRERVAEQLTRRARASEAAGEPPWTPERRRQEAQSLLAGVLQDEATAAITAGRAPRDPHADRTLTARVLDALFGMGGLQPLLDDPTIENINVNGCDVVHVRYADGRRARVAPVAASDGELVEMVRAVAARAGVEERRFDRGAPQLSVQLPDGSRLFAIMAVTARPSVSIRRHRHPTATLRDLLRLGTIDPGLEAFLTAAVRARRNIVVSGGMAAGKTTVLRALASAIAPSERLVTVEDAIELGLDADPRAHPDVVALQAREANIEGEGQITTADLVRSALRMSADRVIVGEVRGSEVISMCLAMSQGNDGSMATVHASSSAQVFLKLAAYAVQAAERLPLDATGLLVASAVHLVVHLESTPDGRRVVASIREVVGADGAQVISNELFRPGGDKRGRPHVPPSEDLLTALTAAGFDPQWLHSPERWWPR
ncbi:CpaF family protein [Cryptosporangium phraense]|uniref:CpaF family protein n=1 Tax=Cryptosporangium phraense TaxID=2593070 RepID=A0A545ANB0_9ACTN|nr:ATPase, T2SS/T4P/T4SS family [Cryptosporangium phraense]TQS42763.1 CpaF family protein [Cryptosporangium phraense]